MRLFNDLRRGLLAASSLATLQVAVPAYSQQYPAYPQTAQPYAQAAQNPYTMPQGAVQQYAAPQAATQPVATQPVAATAPYQQFSAAQQQATAQATQQYNAAAQQVGQQVNTVAQQANQQYTAATQYVASRPTTPVYGAYPGTQPGAQPAVQAATQPVAQGYPTQTYPVAAQQQPVQGTTQPSAFQQVYPQAGAPVAQQPVMQQQPVYVARSMQNTPPAAGQPMTLNPPTEAVPPGAMVPTPAPAPQAVPMADHGYPPAGYESYPSGYGAPQGAGCATGNCAPYGAADYSAYGCEQPGVGDRLLCRNSCNYWFGGVYGLLMQRDSSDKYNLGMVDDSMPVNGYPTMPNIPVDTSDVDPGFQGGVEFRLGRTFGGVSADPCGCSPCCPSWGVEGVYWELFGDTQSFDYMPSMPSDYYSMMPMPGLEYNGGGGYMPLNNFWNYGPPVGGGTYSINDVRVRSNFEARNIEINLLRLNLCGCAPACGPCGGCDGGSCGIGGGAGGCSTGYCAPNRYNITGVCGVRYMEIDDYFMYGVDYDNGVLMGYLDYNARTENRLLGFQLGSNAMYRVGCKWGLHMNTLVGLYGNDISTNQYFNSTTGMVRYTSSGDGFMPNADKTDVSMIGELRLGASYQMTCHCRLYGGWRAMGITGLALATNQAPNQWLTSGQGSSYVNSGDSLILHGLQTGVEWNY